MFGNLSVVAVSISFQVTSRYSLVSFQLPHGTLTASHMVSQDGSPQDEFPVKMSSSAHCYFSSTDLLVEAFLFSHPQVIPCLDSECSCSFIYLISSLSSYYFYGLDTEMGNFHVSGSPGNIVHHLESATLHQLTCTHSM